MCVSVCFSYREPLELLHGGTNPGSCSYFGEVFVVALLGALKVATDRRRNSKRCRRNTGATDLKDTYGLTSVRTVCVSH